MRTIWNMNRILGGPWLAPSYLSTQKPEDVSRMTEATAEKAEGDTLCGKSDTCVLECVSLSISY